MAFATALEAAKAWHVSVDLYVHIGDANIVDVWTAPAIVDGYEFVPLQSFTDIVEEARTMKNCLRSYGWNLAHNNSRLWSIRKNGERIATLEIALWRRDPLLCVSHLAGPGNDSAGVEVWWAAERWLHMHDLPRLKPGRLAWGSAQLNRGAWRELWKPYWLAKKRIPDWLPLMPSRSALEALCPD
jgi:hypothetical protein